MTYLYPVTGWYPGSYHLEGLETGNCRVRVPEDSCRGSTAIPLLENTPETLKFAHLCKTDSCGGVALHQDATLIVHTSSRRRSFPSHLGELLRISLVILHYSLHYSREACAPNSYEILHKAEQVPLSAKTLRWEVKAWMNAATSWDWGVLLMRGFIYQPRGTDHSSKG